MHFTRREKICIMPSFCRLRPPAICSCTRWNASLIDESPTGLLRWTVLTSGEEWFRTSVCLRHPGRTELYLYPTVRKR